MTKEKKIDIHNYDSQLKSTLARIDRHPDILPANKKIILDFYDSLLAESLSLPRLVFYLNRLQNIAIWFDGNFKKATRNNVEIIMRKINRMDYTENTKQDYKVALKKFFKWLRGIDEKGVYPPEVKWITASVSSAKQELPDNLPDEDDVKKMIQAADHPRDKALIASLYESGCRIGELASLRIGDIHFDEYGAFMVVSGKTGSRRIRLIFSAPILASWINAHPDKGRPEAPLWVVIGTTKRFSNAAESNAKYKFKWSYAMKYRAITKMLKKLAQKAMVTKKVNPHAWRHARATYLANKLTEQQLKHLFGWKQSSDMAAIYVHLSGRDVDDALLTLYGKKKKPEDGKDSALTPLECPRCKEANEYSNTFCKKCGWTLDQEEAAKLRNRKKEADEIINKLTEDPENLKLIAKAIAKLGLVDELMKI